MMRTRWILSVVLTLISIAAVLYSSYRVLKESDFSVPAIFRPAAGRTLLISMEGYRMVQTEGGRPSWTLVARSAELYENKEARLRDMEIRFQGSGGQTAALIGENGVMDTESGNGSIRRGAREVRVVTSDGYLLTTDSLFWNAADRLVRTQDPFKMLGRELYIEGKGLSADVDIRKVTVASNVKAILQE